MSEAIQPFTVDIPAPEIDDLKDRLRRARWADSAPVDDWSQGVPLDYLRSLCDHWLHGYDWSARQDRLNSFAQFRTEIDGLGIHFLHVRSRHDDALPLVLTHGWPGSVVEFLDVIAPLTDPTAHGGQASDAFHVVVPSLPGYGFSDKPQQTGWGVQKTADAWAALMARLGYSRYGAQGGDWGSMVTTAIGQQDPDHVAGIHINMVLGFPGPDDELTEREQDALAGVNAYMDKDSGYSKQQSTRPQSLGYGLVDSPVGQCAWILEKFWSWSDTDGDPVGRLGADRILDNVMLYWLPATGASSARMYWESFNNPPLGPVSVPMGGSVFPKEIFRSSRRWAERQYSDIRYWNEPEVGGHFAAFEQPEIFVDEVRGFFRTVR
ncbi:MAG TPA: epoxide hydrolase [Acidimicrobiales bacterium]|jgi:pimeloyl-ACP methyl ester carboxylesterase|nr:epoxide hydrolase [Acidimicrobiales bacterium]